MRPDTHSFSIIETDSPSLALLFDDSVSNMTRSRDASISRRLAYRFKKREEKRISLYDVVSVAFVLGNERVCRCAVLIYMPLKQISQRN